MATEKKVPSWNPKMAPPTIATRARMPPQNRMPRRNEKSFRVQNAISVRPVNPAKVMAAALVMCFFIPFFGRLSDRIGRTRVYFWGSLITAAASFPGFWMMINSGGNVMLIWLAIIIPFGILYAAVYGPEAALFCELFDAKVRYTGISFVYQFSGIFASGITPIIATALLKTGGGQPWLICLYVMFAGVVSALCAWLIGRGRQPAELDGANQPSMQAAGLRKA